MATSPDPWRTTTGADSSNTTTVNTMIPASTQKDLCTELPESSSINFMILVSRLDGS